MLEQYQPLNCHIADVCSQPKEEGPCDQWTLQFYYNADAKRCENFYYGGCGGTGNRFETETECQAICISRYDPSPSKGMLTEKTISKFKKKKYLNFILIIISWYFFSF